jgi:hypothetical protein
MSIKEITNSHQLAPPWSCNCNDELMLPKFLIIVTFSSFASLILVVDSARTLSFWLSLVRSQLGV